MTKKVKIPITFNDIVTVLMWDDSHNKENVTSRIPCGTKISYWLARAFTLANMKKHSDRGQYALSFYYMKKLPQVEIELKNLQDGYLKSIKKLKKEASSNPLYSAVDISTIVEPITLKIDVMPCPPVLMFVRVNMLCDEAHSELRKLYQFGTITKSDYFRQRRELFRPLNKFRSDFASVVSDAGKLLRTIQEKTSITNSSG
ncbi:hypothetical protein THOKLE017_P30170 (plasmid) [Klebsiella pneumoniae]|uniref:hypothetical protein n=1 Tax=Klebsiella pneumoniae TaxID=573 RepID=UPI0018A60D98|nr:hypothetical protein [Klebsiella pneumoniae]MDE8392918.1 hypothetical protein [Klebsiella pneumoniae]BBW89480.1 hypothetical protein THOKLE017_P30170 [Klebsiella pneumoniae]